MKTIGSVFMGICLLGFSKVETVYAEVPTAKDLETLRRDLAIEKVRKIKLTSELQLLKEQIGKPKSKDESVAFLLESINKVWTQSETKASQAEVTLLKNAIDRSAQTVGSWVQHDYFSNTAELEEAIALQAQYLETTTASYLTVLQDSRKEIGELMTGLCNAYPKAIPDFCSDYLST